RKYARYLSITLALLVVLPALAAEPAKPVRMGCGIMTFDTVPGWGLRPDGQSALGSTHGGVAVDEGGNIYVSAYKGVVVFSPDGKVVTEYLGEPYEMLHDIKIREEGGEEFAYGARNNHKEGVKFRAHGGEVVLRLKFPEESGLKLEAFRPTAITVVANGNIYL